LGSDVDEGATAGHLQPEFFPVALHNAITSFDYCEFPLRMVSCNCFTLIGFALVFKVEIVSSRNFWIVLSAIGSSTTPFRKITWSPLTTDKYSCALGTGVVTSAISGMLNLQ